MCRADPAAARGGAARHRVPAARPTGDVGAKALSELERPDYQSRTPEGVAYLFEYFGVMEAPQVDAVLYEELCRGVARDRELVGLAARAPVTQPPPNLLFAAVHYLLLRGAEHPLRGYYPSVAEGAPLDPRAAFPAFRDFCLEHRATIEKLIETRLTQTNVIQRCTSLLPAFATVFGRGGRRPLALIEIGPSAGLNLQWSQFGYEYRWPDERTPPVRWGDSEARVVLRSELRGRTPPPDLPGDIPVAWRRGIDIHPIDLDDADAVLWLRALIWPEHVERQERLTGAIEVARLHPPQIVEADAAEALPDLLAAAPRDATLCVYGTHTLYQFPTEARRAVFRAMQAAAASRPVFFVSSEGTGDRYSELRLTEYRDGTRTTTDLARCNPHGRWLEWLPSRVSTVVP